MRLVCNRSWRFACLSYLIGGRGLSILELCFGLDILSIFELCFGLDYLFMFRVVCICLYLFLKFESGRSSWKV